MTLDQIKVKITELADVHRSSTNSLDDERDDEYIEAEAFAMVTAYCENKGYEVNGFPGQKKKEAETDPDLDEDYFCLDRYRYYVDILTLEKDDVAELNWHYYSSFWPEQFENKDDFMDSVGGWVKSGENFYGVEL